MKITGFIWLRNIVDKLDWKHNVRPEEVEDLFPNHPQYRRLEKGKLKVKTFMRRMGDRMKGDI